MCGSKHRRSVSLGRRQRSGILWGISSVKNKEYTFITSRITPRVCVPWFGLFKDSVRGTVIADLMARAQKSAFSGHIHHLLLPICSGAAPCWLPPTLGCWSPSHTRGSPSPRQHQGTLTFRTAVPEPQPHLNTEIRVFSLCKVAPAILPSPHWDGGCVEQGLCLTAPE